MFAVHLVEKSTRKEIQNKLYMSKWQKLVQNCIFFSIFLHNYFLWSITSFSIMIIMANWYDKHKDTIDLFIG